MRTFGLSSSSLRFIYRVLLGAVAISLAAVDGQTPAPSEQSDSQAIKDLIAKYAAAVNAEPIDMSLASQVWLNSPDDSFIHPLGEEHGWENIKRNFYENIMEAFFSERKLTVHDIEVHAYGDSGWAEFQWHFVAKSRKGGSTVETSGRETQVYRKLDGGRWALVHVHYSPLPASPQPSAPAQ
jgi:ketosteroid isomerase-like protein